MRRAYLIPLALLLLIGCAQAEKPQYLPKNDVRNQILAQQFRKKGADLYCDQPAYLMCLGIEREQCLHELKPFNKECFDYASKTVDGDIAGDTDRFSSLFGFCMFSKHVMSREVGNLKEIAACLQDHPFDEQQVHKTMRPTDVDLIFMMWKDQLDLQRLRNERR